MGSCEWIHTPDLRGQMLKLLEALETDIEEETTPLGIRVLEADWLPRDEVFLLCPYRAMCERLEIRGDRAIIEGLVFLEPPRGLIVKVRT